MRRLGLVTTVVTLTAAAGCGGDPQDHQEVAGEVQVKGKPVEDGVVRFDPMDGQATGRASRS